MKCAILVLLSFAGACGSDTRSFHCEGGIAANVCTDYTMLSGDIEGNLRSNCFGGRFDSGPCSLEGVVGGCRSRQVFGDLAATTTVWFRMDSTTTSADAMKSCALFNAEFIVP